MSAKLIVTELEISRNLLHVFVKKVYLQHCQLVSVAKKVRFLILQQIDIFWISEDERVKFGDRT